jgi:hypothetical protein
MGLCPDCGRPVDECGSGVYHVEERICRPTAAVHRWRKEHKDPPPGVVLSAVRSEASTATLDNPTLASAPDWVKAKFGITE